MTRNKKAFAKIRGFIEFNFGKDDDCLHYKAKKLEIEILSSAELEESETGVG